MFVGGLAASKTGDARIARMGADVQEHPVAPQQPGTAVVRRT